MRSLGRNPAVGPGSRGPARHGGGNSGRLPVCVFSCFSRFQLFSAPWTVACSLHGILQARILEWVAMPSFRGPSQPEIETVSPESPALAGGLYTHSAIWEAPGVD